MHVRQEYKTPQSSYQHTQHPVHICYAHCLIPQNHLSPQSHISSGEVLPSCASGYLLAGSLAPGMTYFMKFGEWWTLAYSGIMIKILMLGL